MYEVDFWNVSITSKSGDALSLRFTDPGTGQLAVIVIDGGYADFGDTLADHLQSRYGTKTIDLAISTHPDADHINGLRRLIERPDVQVRELLLHRPSLRGFTGDEVCADLVDEIAADAEQRGIIVTEPAQGLQRFGGALTVVGPSEAFYRQMLQAQVEQEAGKTSSLSKLLSPVRTAVKEAVKKIRRVVGSDPGETLTDDDGGTYPRNNTSVISLFRLGGQRHLLTADAGVPALQQAQDFADANGLSADRLGFVQIPHHGSRHNVDADWLNRVLGRPGAMPAESCIAFASASDLDEDHPHAIVLNAFKRRGCRVGSTEGSNIWHHSSDAPPREDYHSLEALPWYAEDE